MSSIFILMGALYGALAVMLGAFGAHALKESFSPYRLSLVETAAKYQIYHALALVLVGIILLHRRSRLLLVSGWLFIIGTAVFSASLLVLALTEQKFWGAVTPFGGALIILGWLALAMQEYRNLRP